MCSGGRDQVPRPPSTPVSKTTFVGIELEPQSFIIVLDISGSMGKYFGTVKSEAQRALNDLLRIQGSKTYVDMIVYNDQSQSALGGLQELTAPVAVKITDFIGQLREGGGTVLEEAIKLAGAEAIQHGKKTTLLVLTDGEDATIPRMINNSQSVRDRFGGVPFIIHTTHPRLFNNFANPGPGDNFERGMERFSQLFGGRFGPSPVKTPAKPQP